MENKTMKKETAAAKEQDPVKLPVYTAEELQHVRVEACDTASPTN